MGKKNDHKWGLALSKITAEDIMRQVDDVFVLLEDVQNSDLQSLIADKQYQTERYIPVKKVSTDVVFGYIDLMQVAGNIIAKRSNNDKLHIADVMCFPLDADAVSMVSDMYGNGCKLALIVDEFGENVGIVTSCDILDIIFKVDNVDALSTDIIRLTDGSLLANGSEKIKDIERALNIAIDNSNGDVKTIGGLALYINGSLPIAGQVIQIDSSGILLEIISVSHQKVNKVKIRRAKTQSSNIHDK